MGHDGPGHIAIAAGQDQGAAAARSITARSAAACPSRCRVKHGPVTLLSVVEAGDGRLKLLVAEGESVPGPILEIGNTNSRYRFSVGARQFVEHWNAHGPAHHCAVGVGHIADKIEKLGQLLQMEVVQVC